MAVALAIALMLMPLPDGLIIASSPYSAAMSVALFILVRQLMPSP